MPLRPGALCQQALRDQSHYASHDHTPRILRAPGLIREGRNVISARLRLKKDSVKLVLASYNVAKQFFFGIRLSPLIP